MLGNTPRLGKIPSLLLCKEGKHNNWSQTPSQNIQIGHGNIRMTTMHSTQNILTQHLCNGQTMVQTVHSWLAVEEKLCWECI